MTDWTCPDCGQTVHGIGNKLDLALAKTAHSGFGCNVNRSGADE